MITGAALGRETAAAAAALDGIRVVEREAAFFQPLVKVEDGSIEEQRALLIDGDFDAVLFDDLILRKIDRRIKAQAVLKTAATATNHADAQQRFRGQLLFANDPLDLFGGLFCDGDRHPDTSPF